ncbi:MAG: nucleotidyltransferase family protein [Pseudomonadota bacterium]
MAEKAGTGEAAPTEHVVWVQEDGTASPEGKALLRDVLSFDHSWEANNALRQRLFEPHGWTLLVRTALSMRLFPAVAESVSQRNLFPKLPFKGTQIGLHERDLDLHGQEFQNRRAALSDVLNETVAALNSAGIEPVLLKGARYVWLDTNAARTMRDLDFLIRPEDADRAWETVRGLGFAPDGPAVDRKRRHHMPPLFRAGTIGWIELHRRAGNPYAEQFLSTSELWKGSVAEQTTSGTVKLPKRVHHVWHGLVHHQFGHSGFARGRLELKGLYEFATSIADMTVSEWDDLLELAARSPLAWTSFELWCAACQSALKMEVPPGTSNTVDWIPTQALALAKTWLERTESEEATSGSYPGYRELLGLVPACERNRLSQKAARKTWLPAQFNAARMLAPKLIRS